MARYTRKTDVEVAARRSHAIQDISHNFSQRANPTA